MLVPDKKRRAWLRTAMIAALAAAAVLPAQASAANAIAFHGEGSDADSVELTILAPETLNEFTVTDRECGDGHNGFASVVLSRGFQIRPHTITPGDCKTGTGYVPRGWKVISFRMCEPGMPKRLTCGPTVPGPKSQGLRPPR